MEANVALTVPYHQFNVFIFSDILKFQAIIHFHLNAITKKKIGLSYSSIMTARQERHEAKTSNETFKTGG